MRLLVGALAVLVLFAAPAAIASEEQPTSLEIQQELYCTDCDTTLADASAVSYTPEAISYIQSLIAAGDKKSEIKEKVAERYLGHLLVMPSKTAEGPRPTLADLEGEVMCPACNTTLDQSSSGAARQVRTFISAANRGRRLEGRDQGQASRRLRALDPRRPAEGGLQPAGLAAPDRGCAGRSAHARGACLALEPGARARAARRTPRSRCRAAHRPGARPLRRELACWGKSQSRSSQGSSL